MSIDFNPAVESSSAGAVDQFFTVPAGVTFLDMDCQGASSQGAGGRVLARVPVTPGETLKIVVGREASFDFSATYAGAGPGGGGGGTRGGGYAGVFRGSTPLVIAGGGGGFGASPGTQGHGGGLTGQTGSGPGPFNSGGPGTGGTQTDGGLAGGAAAISSGNNGTNGSYLQGGTGANSGGGGGGGGFYGGGGGGAGQTAFGGFGGGGGGGSSYTAVGVTNVIHVQGFRVGAGFISILNLNLVAPLSALRHFQRNDGLGAAPRQINRSSRQRSARRSPNTYR